jgi:hypothetical protein
MREGESLFEFYDTCAVATFATYRSLVNEWLRQLPPNHAAKMAGRMKGRNVQFQRALCELIVYRLLRQLGYDVDIHPQLPHTTRKPDFLARDAAGGTRCYVR